MVQGVMAKRVMDFLWSMMMNPEAPAEISRSPAMTDALTSYAHRQGVMDRKVAYEYIKQCVAQIQNDHSVSAAMNLLQRLVHLSVRLKFPFFGIFGDKDRILWKGRLIDQQNRNSEGSL